MSKTQTNNKIVMLCESAIMIALATVLSMLKIEWPFGGSITICSMLPILVIGYRYKPIWGFFTGIVYGLIQMLLGLSNFAYATSWMAVLMIILFDYLIAYGVVGLGGVFRKFINNQAFALGCGALLAGVLRFVFHFISGVTVWGGFAEDMPAWLYSLTYNGAYMLPETVILIAGAIIVGLIVDFKSPRLGAVKRGK
ncbi:MAG: energy-coupled thiamine transporter ThiT [Ruminococcus sp.]|nr:energy-coupled thiamine transporter ThiT [Ruminococcus sp.]